MRFPLSEMLDNPTFPSPLRKAASLLGGSKGSRYTPVGKAAKKIIGKAASTLPFREYEESSSEVEDFMKPYSDEPEDSPTFMGAYRDQEDED